MAKILILLFLIHSLGLVRAQYPMELFTFGDCLYLYIESLTYRYENKKENVNYENKQLTITDNKAGWECNKTVNLHSEDRNIFPELNLIFDLDVRKDYSWKIKNVNLSYKSTNEKYVNSSTKVLTMTNSWNEIPDKASYSCNLLTLKWGDDDERWTIVLKRFQLQPFKTNNSIFGPSYDCSVWLTLPLVLGFILLALMTFVVTLVIYLMIDLGEQTKDLKFSKQGGMLMNQSQLEATKG